MKKVIFLLLAVLLISTVFVGCDKNLASALASKAKHISLDPDFINVKVGETIEVKAKITDGNDQTVTVDNSKFKWSIAYGDEAISIASNGNTVRITAKKKIAGDAMIKIEHPEALSDIQRVVHITKEGESGGGGGNTGNTSIKRISTDPNLISVKLGETKTVTAKIIDENDHTLQVDNSKFEWSIVMGKDKIKIKPNGKSCEITRIAATGDETVMIKITHPNADKEAKEFVY